MGNKLTRIFNKVKKPVIIVTACMALLSSIFFCVVKWGLPLSDKDILEVAIDKKFMFKELKISKYIKGKTVKAKLVENHMLEDYISLARQDEAIVDKARFSRYFYNNRGYGKAKRKLYEWNYKLNRK